MGLGGLQAELDAGDAAALELATAEALLADLADAHASLTLEAAADGWLGYTQAAALGDSGPLGREGDVASGMAEAVLRHRERRTKRRPRESAYKMRLSQHDDEVLATFDQRQKVEQGAEEAMKFNGKPVAEKSAKEQRLKSAVQMKGVRLIEEMKRKKEASAVWNDSSIDKVQAAT